MSCSSCGMPCKGSVCNTCALTKEMEESWARRDKDAEEEGAE